MTVIVCVYEGRSKELLLHLRGGASGISEYNLSNADEFIARRCYCCRFYVTEASLLSAQVLLRGWHCQIVSNRHPRGGREAT